MGRFVNLTHLRLGAPFLRFPPLKTLSILHLTIFLKKFSQGRVKQFFIVECWYV